MDREIFLCGYQIIQVIDTERYFSRKIIFGSQFLKKSFDGNIFESAIRTTVCLSTIRDLVHFKKSSLT